MKLIMNVYAYDVLEMIQVSLRVRIYEGYDEEASDEVFRVSTTLRGTGETDARLWAQDALVGLLEAL